MPAGFAMMGICTHRLQEYSGDGPPHRCVSRGCPCHCTRTIGNHFRSTSRVLPPSRLLETVHAATTMTAWLPDGILVRLLLLESAREEEMLSNRNLNSAVWDVIGIICCPRDGISAAITPNSIYRASPRSLSWPYFAPRGREAT